YSTLPLTERMPRRAHATSESTTSPLTVPRSSARALRPFARMMPLTLDALRSDSGAASDRSRSPDTVFADSSFGVDGVVLLPLIVSTRTTPWTLVTLIGPETDLASTPAEVGTVTV